MALIACSLCSITRFFATICRNPEFERPDRCMKRTKFGRRDQRKVGAAPSTVKASERPAANGSRAEARRCHSRNMHVSADGREVRRIALHALRYCHNRVSTRRSTPLPRVSRASRQQRIVPARRLCLTFKRGPFRRQTVMKATSPWVRNFSWYESGSESPGALGGLWMHTCLSTHKSKEAIPFASREPRTFFRRLGCRQSRETIDNVLFADILVRRIFS